MLSYESLEGQPKMTNSHHSKMVCVSSYVTSKNFGKRMQIHMVAFFLLFSTVYFQMCRLPDKRYSRIGCIYLIFPQCAFSNLSSKRLHKMMQSHIGCIYLIFFQCVFSNGSSNLLPAMMHNCIGCICLTLLHCVFLNVSSSCLHA